MAPESSNRVIIVGASVRAAAWSALRAGLEPICVDLFADRDLCRIACANSVAPTDYPEGLVRILANIPPAPWFFTGGLENRPRLIERLSRRLPLWGNGPSVLRKVRSPFLAAESLQKAGLPCPAVRRLPPESGDRRRWLLKPRSGAGGRGIAFWDARLSVPVSAKDYFQEWIDGEACAAMFLGLNDGRACFLGATRQLVGLTWFGAGPFQYCGSIGPLPLPPSLTEHYQRLGGTLVRDFGLRGLFGVDCVVRDDVPWPVEINPRYTASTEIIEWSHGQSLLARHAGVFGCNTTAPLGPETGNEVGMLAKAVLFASEVMEFPQDGPWCETLATPWQPWAMPDFADIPATGRRFQRGAPIMTFFAKGKTIDECTDRLRQRADRFRISEFGDWSNKAIV